MNNLQAQIYNSSILYDTLPNPNPLASSFTVLDDAIVTSPANSIVLSTNVDGNGVSSFRLSRMQCNNGKRIKDSKYTHSSTGVNLIATDLDIDVPNNKFIVCGNVSTSPDEKMFLAKIDGNNFTVTGSDYAEFTIPYSPFSHTYALDVLVRTHGVNGSTQNLYYVVGFMSDGVASKTSSKLPFLACFNNNLQLQWYRTSVAMVNPYPWDVFNAITEIKVGASSWGIFVSGTTTRDMINSTTLEKAMTHVHFDYSGSELNREFHVTNFSAPGTSQDSSVIGDIIFDESRDRVYILSHNRTDKGITVEELDVNTFTMVASNSFSLVNPYTSALMDCTGFKLYKHSGDSLGVVGYVDLDSSQIGIEMSIFHTIFSRPTVAPNYAQVFHCEADVTGLGINTYFSTLQYGASSPESFVPSLAYYNTSRGLYMMTNFTNYDDITPLSTGGSSGYATYPRIINDHAYDYTRQLCPIANPGISTRSNTIYNFTISTSDSITFKDTTSGSVVSLNDTSKDLTVIKLCDVSNINEFLKRSDIQSNAKRDYIIYPSPASESIYINEANNIDIHGIEIIDVQGQKHVLSHIDLDEDVIKCDIQALEAGIYFISFFEKTDKLKITYKFIVN
ncbi:MAG: T9SS type A sorting domain-containing protein [Chitinophagales bacterium]|nr:T9SS type A sorting domain-containing protein [Chitinophagales bacterium]